jgi:BASS family bile acid:Na+ symporter
VLGLACQFGVTPLVAVAVGRVSGVDSGLAVGMILVATMPGGALSKLFAWLGKGNLALSISLTTCGTLAAVVTVPLLLRLLTAGIIPDDFHIPAGAVVGDVLRFLIAPLLVGMTVGRYLPDERLRFSRWCIRLGLLAVAAMVVGSLASGRVRAGAYGWQGPVALIAFCVLSQQLSMLPFRLLRWPRADTVTVGVEVTMRNLNLALLLYALLFRQTAGGSDPLADGVLYAILAYAVVAMGAAIPLALNFRRLAGKEAAP